MLKRLFVITALTALFASPTVDAQYFGRNKVQYKDFTFEVLETRHFDVYFYPEEADAARDAARMAERWYARLSKILDHDLEGPQPLVLYAAHPDFEQTNVVEGQLGEGTGGVTEGLKRRIVLPLTGTLAETDHVIGHELVHAFQYDLAQRRGATQGLSTMNQLPLWLVEGMAEYLSIGPLDPNTSTWIRDAAREKKLPKIDHLDDPNLFPYRWGQAFWAYLAGRWGDDVVGRVYKEALRSGRAVDAVERTVGVKADELSMQWHEAIQSDYAPVLARTQSASAYGRPLVEGDAKNADDAPMSVSPSLSPDGRQIVYFSQRDLLSVDLYLADTETGKVIRRLVSTALDGHFTSLQFINSAGSWHPRGHQFVFGAVAAGAPELVIVDTDTGDVVRERRFPELGEILNPSWAPDGRTIAFSANDGGFSDLFLYDLDADALRRMTDDAFADLQPAWAPDGRRLAFVTDRFSTDLPTLAEGRYQLAVLDASTGAIDVVPTFDTGKSINPQWAPDGRHVFFVSDRDGVSNVYVTNVETGEVRRVTNLNGGATGITALSPALSSPIDSNRLAFSAYEGGQPGIYVTDDPAVMAGSPVPAGPASTSAGLLPPVERKSTELVTVLADMTTGLPETTPEAKPYKPRLSLDSVGQPYVSAGVNQFGPTVGGGLSFLWSDMLGNHNLLAGIDINTYGTGFTSLAKNTGGLLAYQNRTHRWNWGLDIQQAPYVASGYSSGVVVQNGQAALAQQYVVQRQTYRSLGGSLAYPFDRSTRLEFSASADRITFDQDIQTQIFSLDTGRRISNQTQHRSLADPLNLGTASLAAVNDSAIFGAVTPVAGQRSRFEVAPTFGSIDFTGVVADYRKYVMPVNFYTIAGRILHVGRYGAGSEDSRLLPLFLGYSELVRGYGIGSFTASECTFNAAGSCQEIDNLLGSRILVGSLEFRFPLLRPFGAGAGMYGPLPVEVAFFADAGAAWNQGERPTFLGGNRPAVSSAGVTLRANLLGFAIGQLDFVRPFQRQGRGWMWAFSLTPGF